MVVEKVVLKAIELVASWAAGMVFVQVVLWGCYVVALLDSYLAVLMAAKRVSAMEFDSDHLSDERLEKLMAIAWE